MAEKREWFENWFDSRFYPVLYESRDREEARHFVAKLMHYLEPVKGSRILDIACGEGRFAAQLAGYGHEVMGIDLSEQRIQKAKRMENDHLSFYVHDMRFPFYINYFDYAFNFFTSFGYFETQRDNHMAAHAFADALKPGGLLVVDYFNTIVVEEELVPEQQVQKGGYTFELKRYVQEGKIVKEIKVIDEEGIPHHFQERVSAFHLKDFITLFREANMEMVANFGDYHLREFDPELSPRLIMVFKKQ